MKNLLIQLPEPQTLFSVSWKLSVRAIRVLHLKCSSPVLTTTAQFNSLAVVVKYFSASSSASWEFFPRLCLISNNCF